MNEFEYDAYLKKITARSASKRVGNRKGCKLPSDYLTPAQKKRLSGEVKVLNLNQPITYEEFKGLDKSLQETYINQIIETYHVGLNTISLMMGAGKATLHTYVKTHGLSITKCKGGTISRENLQRFYAVYQPETAEREDLAQDQAEPEQVEREIPPEIETRAAEISEKKTSVSGYEFAFRHVTEWDEILKLMGNMPLPENAQVHIRVRGEEKYESEN